MTILEATEISGLTLPGYPSAAANKKYIDSISSNIDTRIDSLSDVVWSGAAGYVGHSGNSNIHHAYASTMAIGLPEDGVLAGGTLAWTSDTKVTTALDDINEILSELAPADATALAGALTIAGTTLYTNVKLASGANLTYKSGEGPGSTVSYVITDGTFVLDNASQSTSFNAADNGVLEAYLNGSLKDQINLGNAFVEADRDGDQGASYSSNQGLPYEARDGYLTIESVGKYNDFQKWQLGNAHIDIAAANLVDGYNWIFMRHDTVTDVSSSNYEIWFDPDPDTTPTIIGTPNCSENAKVGKYISGIEFYYRGSTFDIHCSSITCFRSIYDPNNHVFRVQDFPTLTTTDIAFTHADVTGPSDEDYPVTGSAVTMSGYTITIGASNTRDLDANITCKAINGYDQNGGTGVTDDSSNRLVDAYLSGSSGTSTDVYEYFDDEWYRLPSGAYDSIPGSTTGAWDSQSLLGNSSSQIYGGKLYDPTTTGPGSDGDFNITCTPIQTTDYSSLNGPFTYYRSFEDDGTPHTNGQLELGGLTDSDVDPVGTGDVNVEIKLPTQTGWLDLGTDYDSGTFTGVDGDGCQTAQSGDDWSWTSGAFTTANSGYMIIVRITIRNSAKSLTQVRELGW